MSRLFHSAEKSRYLDKAQDFVLHHFSISALSREWQKNFHDLRQAAPFAPLEDPRRFGAKGGECGTTQSPTPPGEGRLAKDGLSQSRQRPTPNAVAVKGIYWFYHEAFVCTFDRMSIDFN